MKDVLFGTKLEFQNQLQFGCKMNLVIYVISKLFVILDFIYRTFCILFICENKIEIK